MRTNKITILGAGSVGCSTAFSLMHQKAIGEIAIIDLNQKTLEAQVHDLADAIPVLGKVKVKAGTYADIKDSQIVVVACGAAQVSGAQSRLDLVSINAKIMKEIVPKIFKQNPKVLLIMVTNPVDVLTQIAISLFPDKKKQIFGTGTLLDTMRLKYFLAKFLSVDSSTVDAYMAGEHGDSSVAFWSTAKINGKKLVNFSKLNNLQRQKIDLAVKKSAAEIIAGKGATFYGIGAGTAYLISCLLSGKKTTLPLSHLMNGEYGLTDVCLSVPTVIDKSGIVSKVILPISPAEKQLLHSSAAKLKEVFKQALKV
ncbi:MAG: L-lactate dehydrogenase [Patescibacteria group bacterium]|jgi:L-lactate dehydrogenase